MLSLFGENYTGLDKAIEVIALFAIILKSECIICYHRTILMGFYAITFYFEII